MATGTFENAHVAQIIFQLDGIALDIALGRNGNISPH